MKISFCIPLYNKAFAIERTVLSIIKVVKNHNIDYEIKISNNGSTDISNEELIQLLSKFENIDIYYIKETITAPENWFFALTLGKGDILKLQLADDCLVDFDMNLLLNKFNNSNVDYIIGKTKAVFEDKKEINTYFDDVNKFRTNIINNLNLKDKIKIIEKYNLHYGINMFGDINALYFKRDCIQVLKYNYIHGHPTFRSFPDFEIYLRLFIEKNGLFFDVYISTYYYNETSPANRAKNDRVYKYGTYTFMSNMFIYEFINDRFYEKVLIRLSLKAKIKLVINYVRRARSIFVKKIN